MYGTQEAVTTSKIDGVFLLRSKVRKMPRLEETVMNALETDAECLVEMIMMDIHNNSSAEDIYNEMLDGLDENEYDFWNVIHTYDELTHDEIGTLAVCYIESGLVPMVNGQYRIPMDNIRLLVRHYYKFQCIHLKVWLCGKIQSKMNAMRPQL